MNYRILRRRVMGVLCWLSVLGLTGCIIPIPTIPVNLPAHGHTYRIHDQANRPVADEGLLIVTTYYNYAAERVDCYPIRNGKATVPAVFDVRTMPVPMFGYFSLVVPSYFICSINGHHANVYPLVPGYVHWEDFSPLIGSRQIYGVKPRPEVLRTFPCTPYEEHTMLNTISGGMNRYFIIARNSREYGGQPSREDLHNEQQALRIRHFIRERRKSLAERTRQRDVQKRRADPLAQETATVRVVSLGLSPAERAFRALDACDYVTLKRELTRGLDPTSYDHLPWTLLNRAIALGDMRAVRMLVEKGADINRRLPQSADAWYSFYRGQSEAEMARARIENQGYSPLVLAASCGQLKILKYLELKGAKVIGPGTGYTLMHAAADRFCDIHTDDGEGRRAVVAYLLTKDRDINAMYKPACSSCPAGSPLDLASDHRKTQLAKFLKNNGGKATRPKRWSPPVGTEE